MSEGNPEAGLAVTVRQSGPIPLDVAFKVARREFMALVGPSGSGKTTTLRTIAGHHRPAAGAVVCNGVTWLDTARGIDVAPRRRKAGLVFQSYALFPHLSALGNVLEAMRDRPAATRADEARALLRRLHLAGLEDKRPAAMSGGQQQRVAVARALARRPDVLLLDEPFSAVDRPTRKRLFAELAALRSEIEMPVVLVTHDLDEAAYLADTIMILSSGRAVAHGPAASVLARLDLGTAIERDSAATILHAVIIAHDRAAGITFLDHPAGRLSVPLAPGAVGSRIRIRISARDVALAVGEPGLLSIRNRLAATVAEIVEGPPPLVEVRLDIAGEPLIANITRDAAHALSLSVGQAVTALIKSVAIDPLSVAPITDA